MTLDEMILDGKKAEIQLYSKIKEARTLFLKSDVKKTGLNKFQHFKYYTLDDIVPVADEICNNLGLLTMTNVTNNTAIMQVIDIDTAKSIDFKFNIPLIDSENSNLNNAIQDMGKTITYARRYLYMLFLDIVEFDSVDSANNKVSAKKVIGSKKKTPNVQEIKQEDNTKPQKPFTTITPEIVQTISYKMNNELAERKLDPTNKKNRRQILDTWKELGLVENIEYKVYETALGLNHREDIKV